MLTLAGRKERPWDVPADRKERPQDVPVDRTAPDTTVGTDREEVLARAREGDSVAFAMLIRQYQGMVFSLALHSLRSRPAAEDLAQEVFLELYRHLPRIESAAHAASWLRRVTSHRCIDEIRRRQHRPELTVETMPEHGVAPRSREFFLEDRLQSLVATLPPRARMVVVLRYQEELEPLEIAETLNMPINTVKSHLRRSLILLRARLTTEERRHGVPVDGEQRSPAERPQEGTAPGRPAEAGRRASADSSRRGATRPSGRQEPAV